MMKNLLPSPPYTTLFWMNSQLQIKNVEPFQMIHKNDIIVFI